MIDTLEQIVADLEMWRSRCATKRGWHRGSEVDRLSEILDRLAALATPTAREPVNVTDDQVFRLAYWMAEKDGNDDPHLLIWERTSSDPPEPWGEVWQKYEDDARAALTAALGQHGGEAALSAQPKGDGA